MRFSLAVVPSLIAVLGLTDLRTVAADDSVTRVSLHVKDAPLPLVLSEISRQTGVELGVENNAMEVAQNRRVTHDLDDVPFWEAVRAICPEDWAPVHTPNGPSIVLRPVGSGTGSFRRYPMVTQGPFMVLATELHFNQNFSFPKRTSAIPLILELKVYADPSLKILEAWQPVTMERATMWGNMSGVPLNPSPGRYVPGHGAPWEWNLQGELVSQAMGVPERIRDFRAAIRFAVQEAAEMWQIDTPLNARNLQREVPVTGETLSFVELKPNESGGYVMTIDAVSAPPAEGKLPPLFPLYNSGLLGRIRAYDATGNEFDRFSTGTSGTIPQGSATHRLLLQPRSRPRATAGPPVKISIEIPTRFREVDIAVHFNDLGAFPGDPP